MVALVEKGKKQRGPFGRSGMGHGPVDSGPRAPLAPKTGAAEQSAGETLVCNQTNLVTPDRDKGTKLSIYC